MGEWRSGKCRDRRAVVRQRVFRVESVLDGVKPDERRSGKPNGFEESPGEVSKRQVRNSDLAAVAWKRAAGASERKAVFRCRLRTGESSRQARSNEPLSRKGGNGEQRAETRFSCVQGSVPVKTGWESGCAPAQGEPAYVGEVAPPFWGPFESLGTLPDRPAGAGFCGNAANLER